MIGHGTIVSTYWTLRFKIIWVGLVKVADAGWKVVLLARPSQDVSQLPLILWIEQGDSILLFTLIYDLCDGLTILDFVWKFKHVRTKYLEDF